MFIFSAVTTQSFPSIILTSTKNRFIIGLKKPWKSTRVLVKNGERHFVQRRDTEKKAVKNKKKLEEKNE